MVVHIRRFISGEKMEDEDPWENVEPAGQLGEFKIPDED
jgi:hypothetical protein